MDGVLPGRLLLLLALAVAALRFHGLGTWSLWLDEVLTLADSRRDVDVGNPLGYLLFGAFYRLVGGAPDELLLRLPSAVLGFACVPAAAWALRPALGRGAAGAVALVLAASSWGLTWSQTARFYTALQLLGILGTGAVLRGWLAGRAGVYALGISLVVVAALFHPTAGLLLVGLVAAPWLAARAGGPPPTVAVQRVTAGLLLVGALAASGWGLSILATWRARHDEGSLPHFVLTTGYYVTPTVALAFLVGLVHAFRGREARALWLATAACCALGSALLASLVLRVNAQYVFVQQPLIVALACLPLRDPASWLASRGRALAYVLLLLLPGAADSALYLTVRGGDRPDWRGAYAYVNDHLRPGDLILGMDAPVAEYYLDPTKENLRDWESVVWLDDWRDDLAAVWARYPRRIWLVVNEEQMEDWSAKAREDMRALLREECRVTWERHVPWTPRDLSVRVYLRE